MTIDDELILELIKPNIHGKVGERALIIKIVGTRKIKYELEEPTHYWGFYEGSIAPKSELVKITPDITVTIPQEQERQIAIELENDVHWDFGESLRQVKKYKGKFEDTRVIIPEEYKRFAPLYKNEGFRVYLWKAKRRWQCLRCGTITDKEGPIQPICKNKECGNKSRNEFRLVGVKDTKIEEYTS